jgi:nucleotide-binding universal stress UspA family protein
MAGAPFRPRLTALIDRSAYAISVGEHAAWLAERLGLDLQLRHVREATEPVEAAKALLSQAADRLLDQGASAPDLSLVEGSVLAGALSAEAKLVVMGKRGQGSGEDRTALGGNVEAVIRGLDIPVCLTAQVFLPIHRVLAVTDADPQRHAALDLLAQGHGLADLELDAIVVTRPGEAPEAKLAAARAALDERAGAFAIPAADIGQAVWRYLEDRPADLIVISRAVLLADGAGSLRASAGSLWAARAPVIVC